MLVIILKLKTYGDVTEGNKQKRLNYLLLNYAECIALAMDKLGKIKTIKMAIKCNSDKPVVLAYASPVL